ncbi:MAG: 2-succinyl-5-enolpyruvyl-6-hydroxy-3-cyclohexene-1-carboxylic-acid synthase [Flavobacteriaceae bacterium]
MKYSNKQNAQELVCSLKNYGIRQIVISPGSRNAPLTISLTNDSFFETFSIVDERAAAFFALGLIQQSGKPVVVCCTSGSALLNYYPAVAEAYYSKLPLIVLSADRPEQLIDIGDGQTIRQQGVFNNHIEGFFQIKNKGKEIKTFNRAFRMAIKESGPVHINIPFDEPLYDLVPEIESSIVEAASTTFIEPSSNQELMSDLALNEFAEKWNQANRKMVLVGARKPSELMNEQIGKLLQDPSVIVLCESLSNIDHPRLINQIDQLIFTADDSVLKELKPDILISFGGMIVSKKIKQILRTYSPEEHWHISPFNAPDTFFALTDHIKMDVELFFSQFFWLIKEGQGTYQNNWIQRRDKHRKKHAEYVCQLPFSDFYVFSEIFRVLPKNILLQLANSSVVRYAQLFDYGKGIASFANRGTSGIDGSTSTAIGAAYNSDLEMQVFVSGDTSFFYDANGLWNNYIPQSLKIIVINNNGGGIFRILPGPKKSGALSYFETPHNRSVKDLCKLNSISYRKAIDEDSLVLELSKLFQDTKGPKVLEVFTDAESNDKLVKKYFKFLAE